MKMTGYWKVSFTISYDGNDNFNFEDLPEEQQDHISEMIKQGYSEGEIVD